jgi:hypothetical protein
MASQRQRAGYIKAAQTRKQNKHTNRAGRNCGSARTAAGNKRKRK